MQDSKILVPPKLPSSVILSFISVPISKSKNIFECIIVSSFPDRSGRIKVYIPSQTSLGRVTNIQLPRSVWEAKCLNCQPDRSGNKRKYSVCQIGLGGRKLTPIARPVWEGNRMFTQPDQSGNSKLFIVDFINKQREEQSQQKQCRDTLRCAPVWFSSVVVAHSPGQ